MAYDMAPWFKQLIRKLPEERLHNMRIKLNSLNDSHVSTQKMIVTIDAELLRRKWSRDLGRRRNQ